MIKVDTYFDVTCERCGRSRSTDYKLGYDFAKDIDKQSFRKRIIKEGWTENKDTKETLCPFCSGNLSAEERIRIDAFDW